MELFVFPVLTGLNLLYVMIVLPVSSVFSELWRTPKAMFVLLVLHDTFSQFLAPCKLLSSLP